MTAITAIEFGKAYDNATNLSCPQCRGDYLHHDVVTVFAREQDRADAPSHTLTVESCRQVRFDDPKAGKNPSFRRDGVAIRFFARPARLSQS